MLLKQIEGQSGASVVWEQRTPDLREFTLRTARELRETALALFSLYQAALEMQSLEQLRADLTAAIEGENEKTRKRIAAAFCRVLAEEKPPARRAAPRRTAPRLR